MARKRLYAAAVALILGMQALGGRNAAAQATTRPAIDERAIAVLRTMSETLARANSLSFRAESAISIASPTGQWIHVFGTSRVLLRRPDRLYVETRGDLFPHNFYYDGKRATVYAPDQNLYATEEISGRVHDVLLQIFQKHGNYFPFADVLHFEIHTAMTHSVTSAQFVGTSTVGGVKTDHLAFAGGGLEWEIWIGADDQSPATADRHVHRSDGSSAQLDRVRGLAIGTGRCAGFEVYLRAARRSGSYRVPQPRTVAGPSIQMSTLVRSCQLTGMYP
jgi:hypothetical protein